MLQSLTLEFTPANGAHAGKDIAKIFMEFLKEYQLRNKLQGITLDNAANNTTFINELKILFDQEGIQFVAKDKHFKCLAHVFNLGVQDFLKELDLQEDNEEEEFESEDDEHESILREELENNKRLQPIAKLRKLFIKLKYSEQLRQKLECCCLTVNIKMITPSIDVKTRWNSTDEMISKAMKMKIPLNLLCTLNQNLECYALSENDWTLLAEAHKHLRHFKYVSQALCGEKYLTLPLVIIAFNLLLDKIDIAMKELEEKIDSNLTDLKVTNALYAAKEKLLKHYNKCNWIYCIVLILDPRFKIEMFDRTEWGKSMKAESIKKFEGIYKNEYYVPPAHDKNDQETSTGSSVEQIPTPKMKLIY